MQLKKQQLEPDMEQWTGSKLEKEYSVRFGEKAMDLDLTTSGHPLDHRKNKGIPEKHLLLLH